MTIVSWLYVWILLLFSTIYFHANVCTITLYCSPELVHVSTHTCNYNSYKVLYTMSVVLLYVTDEIYNDIQINLERLEMFYCFHILYYYKLGTVSLFSDSQNWEIVSLCSDSQKLGNCFIIFR